jgi:2-polyprenyl-3-methyl-5-hydroxy-6-metoxy-1,4-benzoquinol methylase
MSAPTFDADLGNDTDNATMAGYYSSFRRSFGPLRRHKYDLQLDGLTDRVRSGDVKTVLDIGCGCGSVSLWLALQGAEVTGVDIEAPRLSVAKRRAELLGLHPEFMRANILDLTGQYDAIWIEQAYHHLEPRAEIQAKVASLLKPGGRLIISETNAWNPLMQGYVITKRGLKTMRTHTDENGKVSLYADERITTPSALSAGFRPHGVVPTGTRYFGVLWNKPWMERFAVVERMMPPTIAAAHTHYLWEGRKA